MDTSRRLFLGLVAGAAAWASAACGNDVSVVADPAPVTIEATPTPNSTVPAVAQEIAAPTEDVDEVVADPASTAVPLRTRGQQSTLGQTTSAATTYQSIRDVDFMNGFTFTTDQDFGSPDVTVTDGAFANGEFGDPDYYWFGVTDVVYGDMDGDDIEDALVATSWNGGGSGYFDSVRAFRLADGGVETAGVVPFGDRADGGIFDVQIENGTAYVWSFSTTLGACCPNQVTRNTLALGDYWLAWADRGPTRTWLSFNSNDGDPELKFLPRTSSAVVAMYGFETDGVFTFEAAQGQVLTLALTNGPAPATVSVRSLATGQVMSGLEEMVLPADGFYQARVSFDQERNDKTIFEVIIDDGESARPVAWTPATEQVLVTETPYVTSSLIWPVFASDQSGTDNANAALADLVTQFDDDWIQDVTELSEPQDDSTYDVNYEVTLAAPDLVSVRFDFFDYVCCRPYPNYGPRSAVLDLAAGRLLTVSEIVDTNRIAEINRLWITELEQQGVLPDTVDALLAQDPQFDSVTLRSEGVEFGTERNSLGGGMPGTLAIVSYADLGDLVNPAIVARATTG